MPEDNEGGSVATLTPPPTKNPKGKGKATDEGGDNFPKVAKQPDRSPMLGDKVVYVLGEKSKNAGQERAAFVSLVIPLGTYDTEKFPGQVNLTVFAGKHDDFKNPSPTAIAPGVTYDADGAPGTWHYADAE